MINFFIGAVLMIVGAISLAYSPFPYALMGAFLYGVGFCIAARWQ